MSVVRTAVIILFVGLLAVDLAAANAVVAADRTVLDAGFVTTTLDEEDAYAQIEPLVIESLPVDELGAVANETPLPVDTRALVSAALDSDYIQSQVEPNIERTYAYLHGERDDLELVVDLEPMKTAVADAVEAELTNASAAELLSTAPLENESLTVEARGVTVDLQTVVEMAEDETVFEAERAELRAELRAEILTRLVDQAFAAASDDDLLALVIEDYDPTAYTDQEKAQLVDDNEAEIRAALRDRIEAERGDEIDAEVDRQLAENRVAIRSEVATSVNESLGDADPAVVEPTTDLFLVAVDGYVADVSHDEFSAAFEAAADDLAAGGATVVEARLDEELPDQMDLTEELDPAAVQSLQDARRAVGLVDLLALVLPLVGLGLVGVVFLVSRTAAVTAIGAGVGLTLGGLPGLVGSASLPALLQDGLADAETPPAVAELVRAMAGQVADAVLLQSAVVVGLGVVLLAVGLALYYEVVELPAGGSG